MRSQQLRPLASTGLTALRCVRHNGRMSVLLIHLYLLIPTDIFVPDILLERVLAESYLIQHSYFSPEPPISSFPQSLKERGSGSLQLRMRLLTESRAWSKRADVGSFDVRRTDWATLRNLGDPSRAGNMIWSRQDEDWDPQTLYVVSCSSVSFWDTTES
jgi:hypothetical protein